MLCAILQISTDQFKTSTFTPKKKLGHIPLHRRFHFLRESIRDLRSTGSVAPSSRFLCRAMVSKIDPDQADVVVELGPGDGVITRFLLERLKPDTRLLLFEINHVFVKKIRAAFDDPRLTIIHDSAGNMGAHFRELGIETVDYFVSALPFTSLPESLTARITCRCNDWLRAGGRFIQFHYSPLLLPFYRRVFGSVAIEWVPFNIPPAIVISCEKRSS